MYAYFIFHCGVNYIYSLHDNYFTNRHVTSPFAAEANGKVAILVYQWFTSHIHKIVILQVKSLFERNLVYAFNLVLRGYGTIQLGLKLNHKFGPHTDIYVNTSCVVQRQWTRF